VKAPATRACARRLLLCCAAAAAAAGVLAAAASRVGNGSSGSGTPSNAQTGPQPSLTLDTSSCFGGMTAWHSSFQRVYSSSQNA
jgi:hypothetical protein